MRSSFRWQFRKINQRIASIKAIQAYVPETGIPTNNPKLPNTKQKNGIENSVRHTSSIEFGLIVFMVVFSLE